MANPSSSSGAMGGLYRIFRLQNYPQDGGTRPLAHDRPIIRYPSLKRSQNVFAICLDIAMCSPYNLFAPFGRPSPWKVSIGTGPDLCPEDRGFVVSPSRLQAQTSSVQPFHTPFALRIHCEANPPANA